MPEKKKERKPRKKETRPRAPKRPALRRISTTLLLQFYDAWLREDKVAAVAAALDTTTSVLVKWIERFPELKEARDFAESQKKKQNLTTYMFEHLSPGTRKIWDEMMFYEDHKFSTEKFRKILEGKSKKIRQEIYLHALTMNGWNPSKASKIACVPMETAKTWVENDPIFRQILQEMEVHRKNFYENCLHDLAQNGNPGAIMFINRTLNANRGYNERMQINHQHSGEIRHVGYRVQDLELSMATRKEILKAVRARKIIDVEEDDPKELPEPEEEV